MKINEFKVKAELPDACLYIKPGPYPYPYATLVVSTFTSDWQR